MAAEPPAAGEGDAEAKVLPVPSFELVTLWGRSDQDRPEQGRGRVTLVVPGRDTPTESNDPYLVDLTRYLRLRQRLRISGLPLGGEGDYLFLIEGKADDGEWRQMFELPLRVVVQTGDSA